MTSTQQDGKTLGLLLSDNSVVNINGVRARLQVDSTTGCIHVIHLDKDPQSEHESTPLINENLPLQNTHSLTKHTSHQNSPSLSQTNFEDRVRVIANQPKGIYQEIKGTRENNVQAIPQSSSHFQNPFREEHRGNPITSNNLPGLDSNTGQSNDDGIHSIADPSLGTTQDIIGPHSSLNKFSQAQLDITSIRADQHLDREVLEQDLLEQFLSSVTQDFSFSGSVPTEPANSSSIEQGLFLPATKADVSSLIVSDPPKSIPVSPYPFFGDSDLKSAESVSKRLNTKLHPNLPLGESDVEKHASLNNWTFQAERLESFPKRTTLIENQLCKGDFPGEASIESKSYHRKGQVLKRRGRKPKLRVSDQKLKLIRPKSNIQKLILLNMSQVLPVNIAKLNTTLPQQTLLSSNTGISIKQAVAPINIMQANTGFLVSPVPTSTVLSTAPIPPKALSINMLHCDADNNPRLQMNSHEAHHSNIHEVSMATCPVCRVATTTPDYRLHLLTHPNMCVVCEMVFDVEENLFQHLTNHSIEVVRDEDGIAELKCRVCQAQFLHPGNVQRHILSHCGSLSTGDTCPMSSVKGLTGNEAGSKKNARLKKVVCHKCGKLLGPKCLAVHVKSHCPADDPGRQTNPMHCNVCRGLFRNLTTLRRHLPSCSLAVNTLQQESVTCDACLRTVSVHSLTTHKRLYCSAANPKSQTCPFCDTKLKHKHSLRNHIRWHCKKSPGAESPTKCVCGKVFRNYKAFQSHYQNHCLVRAPLGVL